MNYHDCLDRLFTANERGEKTGLANITAMLAHLNQPEQAYKSIHIAGTNGKGSTVTKIARALSKQGYKVGLYTSPHISTFCERIQIDSRLISEEEVTFHLNAIFALADSKGLFLTFFEYATLLAFVYFAKERIDIAVLETGLGGRLDATNVCSPILTAITSISLDHTRLLGGTKELIASEKAGIMKAGVPCVVGPSVPRSIVEEHAKRLQVALKFVSGPFANYEEENCALARSCLELLANELALNAASIEHGLQARPSCRFEVVSREALETHFQKPLPKKVILDVAHNPDGIEKLFSRIKEPCCVLAGFSRDKDVAGCLEQMREVEALFLVSAKSARTCRVDELKRAASKMECACFTYDNVTEGLDAAFDYAARKGQILVICGTFYIMDECRQFLRGERVCVSRSGLP